MEHEWQACSVVAADQLYETEQGRYRNAGNEVLDQSMYSVE